MFPTDRGGRASTRCGLRPGGRYLQMMLPGRHPAPRPVHCEPDGGATARI
ncbi:MAG TPA: hypothetical protein VJT31_37930 [Rugosimonospora sp.]|nr:hypothetical protein [Rugosimonospora sp.]